MATPTVLPDAWEIPSVLRNRVGHRVGRQRAMLEEGHLLLVVHEPPAPDETTRKGGFFWRNPAGEWFSNGLGAGPAAFEKHLSAYEHEIHSVDLAEQRGRTADDYFHVIDRLAPLLRAARHLHQVLQDARKLLPGARELIDLRDRAYEIERSAELLSQDARNSLDYLTARQAEQQARSSRRVEQAAHRLNLLAAFFFPLATICAFFGMNVEALFGEMKRLPLTFAGLVLFGMLTGALLKAAIGGKPPRSDQDVGGGENRSQSHRRDVSNGG